MNKFLQKYENLGCLIDNVVGFGILIVIGMVVFDYFSGSESFKLPLYANIVIPILGFYFSVLRGSEDGRITHWHEIFNVFMWCSGIILVLHTTVGLWAGTRGMVKEQVAPALWEMGFSKALLPFIMELSFYLTWTVLYFLSKWYKWRTPFTPKEEENSPRSFKPNRRKKGRKK